MADTCNKVFIGSPATKIIGLSGNAGNQKFHLIIIAGKCYCRKEQGHILHSPHLHALAFYIRIQLILSHDGVIISAVPEGNIKVAVLGINRLLLKMLTPPVGILTGI